MIQDAKNRPISELFDVDSKVVYVVPRYQREYTWSRQHWEALFDDLQENDPGYFLGSLICINQSTDALSVQELEVVDGQQRLTTLSLLFAAIYRFLKEHMDELDEDQIIDLANLKRKLVLKKAENSIRVVPQIQSSNLYDYRAVLADVGVTGHYDRPKYAGNRRIYRSFKYISQRIDGISISQPDRVSPILELLDKVNRASLVKIEVASHADAYTLFESLNNRGMPLTAIDLIKNKLLAKLESAEPGRIDHYFGHWNSVLSNLGDEYKTQERFFRQYYNAFKSQLNEPFRGHEAKKKDPLGSVATRSNLIQIYEKVIGHDAKGFLDRIREASRLYSIILCRTQGEAVQVLEKSMTNLERIQGAPSYLLLLFLLVNQSKLQLIDLQLREIVDFLVCFFVRRNLTDIPPTRDLTRLFMSLIDEMDGATGASIVTNVRTRLLAVSATEEMFRAALEGPIYEDNTRVTRFILCSIAEHDMTRETWVDLWRTRKKQLVWTIEHVFPKGEHIPQSWVDMMADGDLEKAREYLGSHSHKLGNLTISGYNSALGRKSFEEKRDRQDRKGLPVGYNNGLPLNEDLANAKRWSAEQIDARTIKLVQAALDLFRMDNGDVQC